MFSKYDKSYNLSKYFRNRCFRKDCLKGNLILSKLFSSYDTENDERDLIESGIFEDKNLDLEYMEKIYNEFEGLRFGSRVNFSSLDDTLNKIAEKNEKVWK
jgi:hypothetical protein